jgi:lipopolysaccharide heptosyltransferase II
VVGGAGRAADRPVSRDAPLALAAIRRVLVRAPNWLGDTVMAIPTLRALRQALPDAEVWCLGPWAPTILEAEPGLTRRLDYPRTWGARRALARELRRAGVDLAVLLPNSFESAFHAWLAGARWRVGYAGDGRRPLLTHALAAPGGRTHQVAVYFDLLRVLPVAGPPPPPTLHVSPARRAEARRLLGAIGLGEGKGAVGIQLGAAFGPSKLWPPDRVAALAAALEGAGTPVVFLGSPTAAPLLERVARELPGPVRTLVGRDHPALLPALLAELGLLVSPDSGPAHVAAAVGIPVVALFGPTDPRLTAPMGEGHVAVWRRPPCAPCFLPRCPVDHRCLRDLGVADVQAAVRARLGRPE